MKTTVALILVALLVPLGCSFSSSWSETSVTITQEIELPEGTTFSVSSGEEAESSVTVPEGHLHAGTYTTTSPHLHTPLREAMKMMGRPGAKTTIVVDEEGEIQSVSNEVTMQ